MSNWKDLPEAMLTEIAKRLSTYDDFEVIREVNNHWRSSLRGHLYSCTSPQVPWLMLAAEDDVKENEVDERGFYSLTKDKVHQVKLPERLRRRRCLSSRGWLLTVSHYRSLSLINPFSHRVVHLPNPPYEYPKYKGDWRFHVEKFALSSSPSKNEEDYTVMIIYGGLNDLAVWRPGDSTWTKIGAKYATDVIYAGGVFIFIDRLLEIHLCKVQCLWDGAVGKNIYRIQKRFAVRMDPLWTGSTQNYLVYSQGKLLAINRNLDGNDDSTRLLVAEYNFRTKEVNLVEGLGNRTLFLGSNESFLLEGVEGCKPNSIYLTDDAWRDWDLFEKGGKNMGIYNLKDTGSVPYYGGELTLSWVTPPLWVECKT